MAVNWQERAQRARAVSRQKADTCRCGAEPVLVADGMLDFVKCGSCGAEGPPTYDHYEAAIVGWNLGDREKEGTYPAGYDYQI